MPRTKIAIEPVLLRELKQRAAREGTTVQALVNSLLRRGMRSAHGKYRLEIEGWNGVLQPGVDISDRNSLYRAMEGR
ncbi:MAG TPA: hypothetical protein VIE13_02030 [Terriglobales bacterium]|jgi:hypothetical protein